MAQVTSSEQYVRYGGTIGDIAAGPISCFGDNDSANTWGVAPDGSSKRPFSLTVGTGGITSAGPISGPYFDNVTNVAFAQSPYAVVATDDAIYVDATAGAVTINLPALAAAVIGRRLTVQKVDASANTVTVAAAGANTINGGASVVMALRYETVNLEARSATQWASIMGDIAISTVEAIDGAAGTARDLDYTTAGVLRWTIRCNATAEGGANAGSDFALIAYSDAGAVLGNAITVTRSSQAVTIVTGLTVTAGGLTVTAGGLTVTAGGLTVTAGGLTVTAGTTAVQALTVAGTITMSAAASQLIPGATSFSIRDTANANDNLIVTNAGAATVRAGLTVTAAGATAQNSAVGSVFAGRFNNMHGGASADEIYIGFSPDGTMINDAMKLRVYKTAADWSVVGNRNATLAIDLVSTGVMQANLFVLTAAGVLTISGGITVTAGGLTVTAGGLTVSAGGITVTGASTITGTLGGVTTLTVTTGVTVPGGAQFLTTNTALTNSAAAQTATLANAPTAGNPTKWIGINDNGIVRQIPAW